MDGANAGNTIGLFLGADNITVQGLVINRFGSVEGTNGPADTPYADVWAAGAGDTIQGNLIGTDPSGTNALVNANGIVTTGPGKLIGGTNPAARNIISGCGSFDPAGGAGIAGDGSSIQIEGNYIGTDITGTKALTNFIGIWFNSGGNGATIGGTAPGDGNVISGNGYGIWGGFNSVEGNLIGTDCTGTKALGGDVGIFLDGAKNLVVGGTVLDGQGNNLSRNIISGNSIGIDFGGGSGNLVEGNYIGTDITGTQVIGGPTLFGVWLSGSTANNTIGGTTPAAGNIIAGFNRGNDNAGIYIGIRGAGGTVPVANAILGNSIYDNYVGIFAESGANDSQAAPVLTAAYAPSGATIALGTITSTPSATVRVEFFANAAGDPEGRTLLGSQSVTTDASGHGSFTAFLSALPAGQTLVTATATDPNGNTSEFSAGVTATPLPPSSLSGVVWEDFNDDGQVDFGESGISGVKITLTGTDFLGNAVNLPLTTDGDGAYVFANLYPGNYYLTETPPTGYGQGIDSVGTAGGSISATDQFSVQLGVGVNGLNYNFGELPAAGGGVHHGQTAGIGFWNNKNGQALINALPVVTNADGSVTSVANWLAATLPNTFGKTAGGNNLTGKSNASVAALFQSDFVLKGVKLDAQLLATALSVYATNATLDPTKVAASYGFTVSGDGAGTATVNVGSNGDAFGVASNTTLTLMDLLLATDAQAVNGVLYNGNKARREAANDVYSDVNQDGGI
ncbi:MAG TPA: SdrD B-like domain-containing protein [Gemmataceae bacterium]|nr:SdrD B-like domain-containing protein [Gemmataceae bacterium]